MRTRYPAPSGLQVGEYAAHLEARRLHKHVLRTWRASKARKRVVGLAVAHTGAYYRKDPACRLYDQRKIRWGFNEILQRFYPAGAVQKLVARSPFLDLIRKPEAF